MAVNVTLEPAQITEALAATLTTGTTVATCMVMILLVAVAGTAQAALLVRIALTALRSASNDEV